MLIARRAGRPMLIALLLLLACAYVALLLRHTTYFAAGPDSSGYLSEAKLFASGRLRVPVTPLRDLGAERSLADVFVPLGFMPASNATMVPTYPPGTPLHMLLFALALGWNLGPYLVAPLAALGSLPLMYAVGREVGLRPGWALVGPLLLAPTAVFLAFAMQPLSDVVATFWALLTLWCALRARRSGNYAFVAGAALAISVAVRPTNALMALPLALAIPLQWRAWRNVAVGAISPAAALLWLNSVQYGSPFRFGYGSLGEVLTWSPPGVCARFHLEWTIRMLSPFAAAPALLLFAARSVPLRLRFLVGSWFAVFFLFYSFYDYCPAWGAIRFLLPALPAVIFGMLLTIQTASAWLFIRGRGRVARVVATVLVLLALAAEIDQTSELRVFRVDEHESVFPETVAWTERRVPSNALVVSGVLSGAFYYYGHWTVRWDRLDADRFMLLRAYVGNTDRRFYAVISDHEVTREEFLRRLPGVWTPVGRNRDVTLYRLDS